MHGATLTEDRFGNADSAYSFDGINDYIRVEHNSSLIPNYISFGGWIKFSNLDIDKRQAPISKRDGGAYCFEINHLGNELFRAQMNMEDGAQNIDFPTSLLNFTDWFHIMFTYDGLDGKLYLNGEEKATFSAPGVMFPNQPPWNNAPFVIGAEPDYGGAVISNHFEGYIDEVRIYNRALSESEIQELYWEAYCEEVVKLNITQAIAFKTQALELLQEDGQEAATGAIDLLEQAMEKENLARDQLAEGCYDECVSEHAVSYAIALINRAIGLEEHAIHGLSARRPMINKGIYNIGKAIDELQRAKQYLECPLPG